MKKLSLVLCLSMAFVSCNNENETVNESSNELSINAYIGTPTRAAEKLVWEKDDALGVFVCNGTIEKPYLDNVERYSNVEFIHNGKSFIASKIYLDENPAAVFAYYPYSATNKLGTAIAVESSTQTDYLYGKSSTAASITNKNVDIEMKHALSQIVFKLRKSLTYNEGPGLLTTLKIENVSAVNAFKVTGTLDLGTGKITGTSTSGQLVLMPNSNILLTEAFQSVSSICLPVDATIGKDIAAVFTIDDRQFKYVFPASTVWEAGLRNVYTLTVNNSGLEIGGENGTGITIEEWGSNADSDISLVPIL